MKKFVFAALVAISGNAVQAQNPLFIPDTLSGPVIQLELQKGTRQFFSGTPTQTMGANGAMLGPTVILKKHQNVNFQVKNSIGDTTTLHWHGMHVAPENDGGPHVVILPGATWSPAFEVLDYASTHWYHPHLHMRTNEQVQKGIAGLILVRDQEEAALDLPRRYGLDDFPVIIQTKAFDGNNQIITQTTALDSVLMVNGTIKPYLNAPSQVVRLRVLNGSSERVYNLGFSDNRNFSQIGVDGGLLGGSISMNRLLLAPGERAEILVNLVADSGKVIHLMNYGTQIPNAHYGAAQPGMGPGQTIPNYTLNPLNGKDFVVLTLNVKGQTASPVTSIPKTLVANFSWAENSANITRTLTFMSMNMGPGAINGPFVINNAHFDMDVINYRVPFNNIEIWELRNQTPIAHPFHIHNVPFNILSINGALPPLNMRGRKDVVLVPGGNGVVRFITRFEDFHNDTLPYMYHCHMLTHEDHGMMGQFVVSSPCTIINDQPESVSAAPAVDVNFQVGVVDTFGVAYQWQSNIGFGFQDLQDAGQYSGTNTSSLKVSAVNLANDNQLFRCYVNSNACSMYTDVVKLQVNETSVKDFDNNQIFVYPNPFNDFIHLSLPHASQMVYCTISDLSGRVWYKSESAGGVYDIPAADFNSGMYIVQLMHDGKTYRRLMCKLD